MAAVGLRQLSTPDLQRLMGCVLMALLADRAPSVRGKALRWWHSVLPKALGPRLQVCGGGGVWAAVPYGCAGWAAALALWLLLRKASCMLTNVATCLLWCCEIAA